MVNRKWNLIRSLGPRGAYPYLVVRVFWGVYQRERILIQTGLPFVEIENRKCVVAHPTPFEADGSVSPAVRELLIRAVQLAVQVMKLRMCIVWAEKSCTYVEEDSVDESTQPPWGGAKQMNITFGMPKYRPDEHVVG